MTKENEIKVIRIDNERDFEGAHSIRKAVFVHEQNVAAENEFDEYEDSSIHVLIRWNDAPVATGRIRQTYHGMKCERICVMQEARKNGFGKLVMEELEKIALEKDCKKLVLHAQTHAVPFYRKLGFIETSQEVFYEEGIPHLSMEKQIG